MNGVKRFEVEVRDGKPFFKEHPEGCSVSYAEYESLKKKYDELEIVHLKYLSILIDCLSFIEAVIARLGGAWTFRSELSKFKEVRELIREHINKL